MKRVLFIALLIIAISSTLSLAQDGLRSMFLVNGGVSLPVGPDIFSNYWSFGAGGGIGIGIIMPDHPYSGGAWIAADVSRVFGEEKPFAQVEDLNVLTVFLKSKLNLAKEGKAVPYIPAGVGLFRLSGGDESENAFGGEIGFGIAVNIDESTDFFVEVGYLYGLTEGEMTSLFPAKIGLIISP
jgi:hypothetical protein